MENTLLNKCRTCMQDFSNKRRRKPDKNQNICEVLNGYKHKITIMEILQLIQPHIRIQMDDNLPKSICSCCIQKIISIYDFIEMYRKTDKTFREILKDNENPVNCEEESHSPTNETILEKIYKTPVESVHISLYDLQIEDHLNEDTPKDEESDWPDFDDDSENDLLDDHCNDNEDNDNESIFENPFSDDSDDEWKPESPELFKKNIHQNKSDNKDDSAFFFEELPKNKLSKKRRKSISNDTSANNLTKSQLETSVSKKISAENSISSDNSINNLAKKQLETNEEIKLSKDKDGGEVECKKCGNVFDNIRLWQEHICDHRLENEAKLKYKSKRKLPKQKCFSCEYCQKEFPKHSSYKLHLLVHTGEANHLCTECGKKFKTSGALKVHMLRHKGEKTFHCSLCPKKFVCYSGLYSHMLLHTNNRPCVCDICGSAFRMPHQLKTHSLCHGERKYKCEYCDKRFITPEKRQVHTRTHTGEKPYRCKYCDRAFAQSGDCVKHLRQHVGDQIYMCELCPQGFVRKRDMREHFATHKDDDEETRLRNLEARSEEQQRLQQLALTVKKS